MRKNFLTIDIGNFMLKTNKQIKLFDWQNLTQKQNKNTMICDRNVIVARTTKWF